MASKIKAFRVSVPDKEIETLKEKLALTRLPEDGDVFGSWHFGAPLADVKRLAKYWQNEFDWRRAEERINRLPQFTTTIDVGGFGDVEIHFVHKRCGREDSIPLLFSHGWPGSFIEIEKILPLLVDDAKNDGPSFHVVAPSLPNFGFSEGVSKPGFGIPQYAEVCNKLMLQLGYDQYVTQGGDWGFIVTRLIAHLYPKHCLASHINHVYAHAPSPTKQPFLWLQNLLMPYTAAEKAGLERTEWFRNQGFGYNKLQSTKPSTISFSLADSPVGLLAWIYEKLHDWTDGYEWTEDEVLTWVALYWFSRAGPGASTRIYYEAWNAEEERTKMAWEHSGSVLLGHSYFPRDLVVVPRWYGRTLGKVVFEKYHEVGGHFASWETPELLVGDLREMFGKGGGAESVARKFATGK